MEYTLYKTDDSTTFRALLERCPAYYGGKDMFREKDGGGVKSTSCEEFAAMVRALGAALLEKDLPGRKVAVIGETSVKWIAAYFATVTGGGVIIPVDKELPDDEIANVLNDSGAAAIVYAPSFSGIMRNIEKDVPGIRYFIGMEEEQPDGKFISFDDLVAHGKTLDQSAYQSQKIADGQLSTILYTSGTTGRSKGVMLTQKNILRSAQGLLGYVKMGDVCMSVLPIHHSYEFTAGIIVAMMSGMTICVNDSPRYFLQNLQLFKPDTLTLVPLYVEMIYKKIWANAKANGSEQQLEDTLQKSEGLLARGEDLRRDLFKDILDALGGNLRRIVCGGAPLAAFYPQAYFDFGVNILQGYGITECAPVVSINHDDHNKYGSIGLPLSCNRVIIRDVDADGDGEIWVKGENVMLGYYKNPQATAEVMDDGWFNTGDIGHIDEDGFLFITGRKKNLIVLSNGKNVYPEEIEGYLQRIPYIKEVVVYAPGEESLTGVGLCAEIFLDEQTLSTHGKEECMAMLKRDIAAVNKPLPGYKQIDDFKLRDTEFEKTTKKSIKRFTVKQ
ncbi:MAG TPA: AMP-dependent synthetase [Clostridiales bacterium]|nr:AMP-dependent synthetase [Clostridiales bacterium]